MLNIGQLTPGTRVGHYKGGQYVILGAARDTESDETLVLYRRADEPNGPVWARPARMFQESVTTPAGSVPRFHLLSELAGAPGQPAERALDLQVARVVFGLVPTLRPYRELEAGALYFPTDEALAWHPAGQQREWAIPAELAPDGTVRAWRRLPAYSTSLEAAWEVMRRIWELDEEIVFFPTKMPALNRVGYTMWQVPFDSDDRTELGFADTFPQLACQVALQLFAPERPGEKEN